MSNPCVPGAADFTSSVLHLCPANLHFHACSDCVLTLSLCRLRIGYIYIKYYSEGLLSFIDRFFLDLTVTNESKYWWGKFIPHSYNHLLPFLVKSVGFILSVSSIPDKKKVYFTVSNCNLLTVKYDLLLVLIHINILS